MRRPGSAGTIEFESESQLDDRIVTNSRHTQRMPVASLEYDITFMELRPLVCCSMLKRKIQTYLSAESA
jgi:hypothetical protein